MSQYIPSPHTPDFIHKLHRPQRASLDLSNARAIHLLETQGEVLERDYDHGAVAIRANLSERILRQLRALGVDTPDAGRSNRAGWKGR